MKRAIITTLQHWIRQSTRKPLVLRGARQVGKTWLARHLAHLESKQLIELNFEREPRLFSLFEINEPKIILNRIAQHFGVRIIPNESLLFLDEIQRVPELLGKLRWFAEDMPALAVIAAGSLLDFALEEHEFSMPVGRIQYLYIEPLSFEEFLMALNQEPLVEFLQEYQINQPIPEIIHEKLLHYVREYTFIGGLPAAVEKWVHTSDIMEVYVEQMALVTTYQDDFAKYRKRLSLERLEDIWNATPKMLGKQWKYSQINRTVQSASLKLALHLLKLARICHPIYACSADGLPLAAGIREKIFKVLFLDIGLVSAALGLQRYSTEDFLLANEGGLVEQFVGQGLRTCFSHYLDPVLYYWVREESQSSAEIDYLIQHGPHIIPIEVKSGKTGKMQSLHLLMGLRQWRYAVRFNTDLPSISTISTKTKLGHNASYQLLSFPFYFIGQIHRLLPK